MNFYSKFGETSFDAKYRPRRAGKKTGKGSCFTFVTSRTSLLLIQQQHDTQRRSDMKFLWCGFVGRETRLNLAAAAGKLPNKFCCLNRRGISLILRLYLQLTPRSYHHQSLRVLNPQLETELFSFSPPPYFLAKPVALFSNFYLSIQTEKGTWITTQKLNTKQLFRFVEQNIFHKATKSRIVMGTSNK